MSKEVLQEALELLAVATFITSKLQARQTDVINAGLQALAEQPAQQEPVAKPFAWANKDDLSADTAFRWCEIGDHKTPLYTTPPAQRQARSADTWVGLNLDERAACYEASGGNLSKFADQIEAKLKAKNI